MVVALREGQSMAGHQLDAESPVCLLLHPVGLCGEFWSQTLGALSPCHANAPDLPGHGRAADSIAAAPSLNALARQVVALGESFQRPVALIGCSLGGILAQAAVIRAPALFSHLILANTLCRGPDPDGIEARARFCESDYDAYIQQTVTRWFAPEFQMTFPKRVQQVQEWLIATAPEIHAHYWRLMKSFDFRRELGGVTVPALVISGSKDRSIPPMAPEEIVAAMPTARQAVIEGAGHLAPFEQPESFARMVRQFIVPA